MTTLPPYADLLQLRSEPRPDGSPLFIMPWHEDVMGRPMYLHGGAIAGLLEFAAYATLRQALTDEQVVMKPITVTVDYMLGGRDRETYADAVIERLGRSIANVEAFAWQQDRKRPIASARINFLLERTELLPLGGDVSAADRGVTRHPSGAARLSPKGE